MTSSAGGRSSTGTTGAVVPVDAWRYDAASGSVGNGSTLRLISDIPGVRYTEGRFLPYFFPDVFCEGGDPVKEARENWVTARRAILRKPIDRIGYLKLACQFPEFLDYVESVCNEFRQLYENIKGTTPYCVKTVAVLNSWGRMRSWGCHKENAAILDDIDVILNVGDGDTAHTGGAVWEDAQLSSAIRGFVHRGGGLIGVGEPSGHLYRGHYLQLASFLGVEKETGFTLGYAPIPDLPDRKTICIMEREGVTRMSTKEHKHTAPPRYDEAFKAGAVRNPVVHPERRGHLRLHYRITQLAHRSPTASAPPTMGCCKIARSPKKCTKNQPPREATQLLLRAGFLYL